MHWGGGEGGEGTGSGGGGRLTSYGTIAVSRRTQRKPAQEVMRSLLQLGTVMPLAFLAQAGSFFWRVQAQGDLLVRKPSPGPRKGGPAQDLPWRGPLSQTQGSLSPSLKEEAGLANMPAEGGGRSCCSLTSAAWRKSRRVLSIP